MTDQDTIVLDSGRRVGIHWVARGEGRTVVFCHAAPGAGNFDPDPEETARRRVTLIAVDRPGYGASDPVRGDEWASVDAAADDLAEVLRRLDVAQAGVAGWSAGGRVALALAARHPELVERAAIVATPAPDEFVPWIPPEQNEALGMLRGKPAEEVHAILAAQLEQMLPEDASPEAWLGLLGASPADEPALALPGAAERLAEMLRAAFAQGPAGLAADLAGYTLRPWGFEPAEVVTRTLCLYGASDPVAGSRHGAWWQKNLPEARLEMVPEAGHLLIVPMWGRVLSHLAPGARGGGDDD
ncbi:MAG TPA: alpha/beta fold hydrolase [Anaerolineae bacterium]|nr:alpha/beta fold hydrolase [Anaerolineae bacterium]